MDFGGKSDPEPWAVPMGRVDSVEAGVARAFPAAAEGAPGKMLEHRGGEAFCFCPSRGLARVSD